MHFGIGSDVHYENTDPVRGHSLVNLSFIVLPHWGGMTLASSNTRFELPARGLDFVVLSGNVFRFA
jgi:hypothetical protein